MLDASCTVRARNEHYSSFTIAQFYCNYKHTSRSIMHDSDKRAVQKHVYVFCSCRCSALSCFKSCMNTIYSLIRSSVNLYIFFFFVKQKYCHFYFYITQNNCTNRFIVVNKNCYAFMVKCWTILKQNSFEHLKLN